MSIRPEPENPPPASAPLVADISRDDESTAAAKRFFADLADNARRGLRSEFVAAVEANGHGGYPGLPGFRPLPNLNPRERAIEAHFAQMIADQHEAMLAHYRELAARYFDSPDYCNADLARMLYPPYADDLRARLVLEGATNAAGGYLAHTNFRVALDAPRTSDRPYAMFMAGGPASGKTTSVNLKLQPEVRQSAVVLDSPMATSVNARASIEKALAAGLRPEITLVFRPFEHVSQAAIERTVKIGRPVSVAYLGDAYYNAQATFLRLERKLGDRARFRVLVNDGAPEDLREASMDDFRKLSVAVGSGDESGSPAQPRAWGGHDTKEAMEARDEEWRENLRRGWEEYRRNHPGGELPVVF